MMQVSAPGPVFSQRNMQSPLALIDSCVPDLPIPRPEDGPSSISSQMLRVYPTPRVDHDLLPNEPERQEDFQHQQHRLQLDEYLQAPAQVPLSQREDNLRYGASAAQYQDQSSYAIAPNRIGLRQCAPIPNPFGSPYYRHAVQAAAPSSAIPAMGPMTAALYQRQLACAQQNWAPPAPMGSYGGAMAPLYAPLTSNIMMGPAACTALEFSPLQANLMANPRASFNGRTGDSTPRTSISDLRQHLQTPSQMPAQMQAAGPAPAQGPSCIPNGFRRSSQGQYPSLGGWANGGGQTRTSMAGAGGMAVPQWPSKPPVKSPPDTPLTSCLFGRLWRGSSAAAAAKPQPMAPPSMGVGGYPPPGLLGEPGPHGMPSRFRPSTASSAGGSSMVGGASYCPPGQLQAVPQGYPRYHRPSNWPPPAPRPPPAPTPTVAQAQSQVPTPTGAMLQRRVSFVDGPGVMPGPESRHLRPMSPPSPIPENEPAQPQSQQQSHHYLQQRFPPRNPLLRQRQLQQLQQQMQARQSNDQQPRQGPAQATSQHAQQHQQIQAQQLMQARQQLHVQQQQIQAQQLMQAQYQQQQQQMLWQEQQQMQAQQAQQWLRDQQRLQAQQRVREIQHEERTKAGDPQRKILSSVKMPCWMRREVRMRLAAENEIQPAGTVEVLTVVAPPPGMSMSMIGRMPMPDEEASEPIIGGGGGAMGCIQPWLSRTLSRSPSPPLVQRSPRDSVGYGTASSREFASSSQRPSPQHSTISPRSSANRLSPRISSARHSTREPQAPSAVSEPRSPVAAAMAKAAAKAVACFSPGRSRSVSLPRRRTTEDSVAPVGPYSPRSCTYTTNGSPVHPIEMDLFSSQSFGARLTEPHGTGLPEDRGSAGSQAERSNSKQWWCGLTCAGNDAGEEPAAKATTASSCGGASTIASRFESLVIPEDVPEGDGVATAAAEAAAAAVAAVAAALTMDASTMTPKANATAVAAAEDAAAAVAAMEAALSGDTPRSAPVAGRGDEGTPSAAGVAPGTTAAVAAADAVAAVAAVEAALAAVNAAGANVVADNEEAAEAVETAVAAVEAALAVVNAAGTNIAADSAAAAAAVEDAVAAVAAALQAVSAAGGDTASDSPSAAAAMQSTAAAAAAVQAALAVMSTANTGAAAGDTATVAESTSAAVEAALAAISDKPFPSAGVSDHGPESAGSEAPGEAGDPAKTTSAAGDGSSAAAEPDVGGPKPAAEGNA